MILVYWSFVLALILSSVRVGSPFLAWRLWRRGKWGIGGGRRGGGEGELGKVGEARAREHNLKSYIIFPSTQKCQGF